MSKVESWGRYPKLNQKVLRYDWRSDPLPLPEGGGFVLPHALGRSYGDSCLNDGHYVIKTAGLDKLISFNLDTGVLRAEAGVTVEQVMRFAVPRGFFLPVTPGTRFVSLGGAVANDVHGKNHHRDGSFGHHVLAIELLRSSGERIVCSPSDHADIFAATIGGLGLTGLITWVEIRLMRIASAWIQQEIVRFAGLDDYFALAEESEAKYQYTVAWIDCLARGNQLGRGLFIRGNHAEAAPVKKLTAKTVVKPALASVPIDLPNIALNRFTMRLFNEVYYRKQRQDVTSSVVDLGSYFHPLDAVQRWNRIYGQSGVLQYQFVVPANENGRQALVEILRRTAAAGTGSFLVVLKTFGSQAPAGLMSFPRPGMTLALDFPVRSKKIFSLLDGFDSIVMAAQGALYPAKDARMPPAMFAHSFPQLNHFATFVDPRFSSSFWRRVYGV